MINSIFFSQNLNQQVEDIFLYWEIYTYDSGPYDYSFMLNWDGGMLSTNKEIDIKINLLADGLANAQGSGIEITSSSIIELNSGSTTLYSVDGECTSSEFEGVFTYEESETDIEIENIKLIGVSGYTGINVTWEGSCFEQVGDSYGFGNVKAEITHISDISVNIYDPEVEGLGCGLL